MSATAPAVPDFPADAWFKSSYSAAGNECIEVNSGAIGRVAVRDSKDLSRRPFAVRAAAFGALVDAVRTGAL